MKIGELTLRGETVDVEADVRSGRFWIYAQDSRHQLGSGDTLDAAKAQAGQMVAKRKVKVSVPFATEDGRRGIADGLHASHGSVLATVDGERYSFDHRELREVLSPQITDGELAEINSLDTQIARLKRQRQDIVKRYEFDLKFEVNKAIAEKLEEQGATDGG